MKWLLVAIFILAGLCLIGYYDRELELNWQFSLVRALFSPLIIPTFGAVILLSGSVFKSADKKRRFVKFVAVIALFVLFISFNYKIYKDGFDIIALDKHTHLQGTIKSIDFYKGMSGSVNTAEIVIEGQGDFYSKTVVDKNNKWEWLKAGSKYNFFIMPNSRIILEAEKNE